MTESIYRKHLQRCLQAGYSLGEANSKAKKLADAEKSKKREELRKKIEEELKESSQLFHPGDQR